MTQGEKMVWAAVFAQEYVKMMHPDPYFAFINRDHKKSCEQNSVHQAVEAACGAVEYLREEAPDIKEGFDGVTNVYTMLEEMLIIKNLEKETCEPNCQCKNNEK